MLVFVQKGRRLVHIGSAPALAYLLARSLSARSLVLVSVGRRSYLFERGQWLSR